MSITLYRNAPTRQQRDIFDIFDDFFTMPHMNVMPALSRLPLDLRETDESYIVSADLPGIDPSDVEITLDRGMLTIKGERKSEEWDESDKVYRRERTSGCFSRSMGLPGEVDEENVNAAFDKGVLTITLPKSAKSLPRKIAIES